ncbi:fructosamine kinase family protein [Alphaproteobacteria bacterium]|nr:fructosamine kinase family protein [Alphaproteobacteria bacterium]
MNSLVENQIIKFTSGKNIIKRISLSDSFFMKCEKITLDNGQIFVAKYYQKKQNINSFNSIVSETNSLIYLLNKFPNLFPTIKYKSNDLLIIDYINSNNIKNYDYQEQLALEILKIHGITSDKFGFEFDAQVGGLKQPNNLEENWIDFFVNYRLNMVFEDINKKDSLPSNLNKKIEKLMKDLENRLPKKPKPSLLHGDLWEGNILFHNGELAGLIDPGVFFGHNEMEIAYLTWFKYVNDIFLNFYSNNKIIDKNYKDYEPIYQIFFSLLNVRLWDRDYYIKDVQKLLKKVI